MGSKSDTVVLKDPKSVQQMVDTLKREAKANDIEFTGDKTQGEAKKAGAKIKYKVTGANVKIDVEDSIRTRMPGWNADKLMKEVKKWMGPYIK
jgi:hypothetical protein